MRLTPIVLALLMIAPTSAALVGTWSQENADPLNRGRLHEGAPDHLDGGQLHTLDGRVITQVVEGPAGWALAGTKAGFVYALDATGETVWKADVGDPLRTAPVWTGQVVVAVPRGDTAHAFTATGEQAWTLEIENERPEAALVRMASPVYRPGGDVIISTMAGNVHRVTAEGETVWRYHFGEDLAVEATPAITNDGDVIAAAFTPGQEGEGFLARIDGNTGTTSCADCWRVEIDSQVVGAPTVVGDSVLVPLRDGEALQSRSLTDASLRWETAFDDSVPASPSLHEGLAIVGDIRGTVRGVQVSGGKIDWEFNPLSEGDIGGVATGDCTVLTVADSVAVDAGGTAWTPYWKANICEGLPPQDSGESPFYRLDAATGEMLSNERYPKANHGPSLLGTGVWTGSDQGGVRVYPHGSTISTYTRTTPGEVLLLTNTNEQGSWSISWDGNVTQSGEEGKPPHIVRQELAPGEHEYTITAGKGSSTGHVTVPAASEDEPSSDDEAGPSPDDDMEPPEDGSEPTEDPGAPDEANASEERSTPMGLVVSLGALLAAAWRRGRA